MSTKEDEDELGDDDDGNEDDDDDGDDDDQISPLELCDANLTEQPDLNGQEEEDGEDEMDYRDKLQIYFLEIFGKCLIIYNIFGKFLSELIYLTKNSE